MIEIDQQASPSRVLTADCRQTGRCSLVKEHITLVDEKATVSHVGDVGVESPVSINVADHRPH